MKNNKFTNFLILAFSIMFFNLTFVKALGPITKVGSITHGGYETFLKVAKDTVVFCTEHDKTSPTVIEATCTINDDWNEAVRYGVATIIKSAQSGINKNSPTAEYFSAVFAINRFLKDKGAGGADIDGTGFSGNYRDYYENYLSAANSAYGNYSSISKVNITLSTYTLNFTLNGDNYESNSVTVSGVDSYEVSTSIGSVSKSGSTFKVVVPASTIDAESTVTVTVSSSKSFIQARNYDCGSGYQTITPIDLEEVTKSDSKSLSGTISPKAKLIINKVDTDGNHLTGATIVVTGPNGYSQTFTTTGSSITLDNLEYGTYTITETSAPEGYIIAESKEVDLSSTNLTSTVTITDKKNKIYISKLDMTGEKELPGASLEVQDEEGNVLYKWISTDTAYIIEGLPSGKYYLVETSAPEGYVLNKEKIEFIVKDDDIEVKVTMKNELEVEVPNTLSSRSALLLTIAMFDIALGIGIVTYVKKNKIEQ